MNLFDDSPLYFTIHDINICKNHFIRSLSRHMPDEPVKLYTAAEVLDLAERHKVNLNNYYRDLLGARAYRDGIRSGRIECNGF